ncbi:MAG: M1 family metallopeptidase [Sulfolobaceae archaeon]
MISIDRYEIFLDIDYKGLKYKGKEKIYLESDQEIIEINSVGLNIINVSLNGKEVQYKQDNNKIIITNREKINGWIEIEFSGEIPERLTGIYKAEYESGYIITTQFESIHAREFIPCIDNPSYKAEFELVVRVDKDLDVIFNTPPIEVKYEGDKKIIKFERTPRMSTYLLYLGIGKFEEISDRLDNINLYLATTPGKSNKGKFGLEVAKRVLKFYEGYFEIPYKLPKLHLIAVPQFAFGAMENWGAITFRETALLADEKSSLRQRQSVAIVIAHEIAHQWFGNLVTMKWWDDLWLNESFATIMSYKAVDNLYKDWLVYIDFLRGEMDPAMTKDSLSTTHPIHAVINNEEEVEQIFDDISYGKGANVLRMIEAYVGEEKFRKGISSYLKKFSYSNATAQDFWNSIQEISGEKVSDIIREWITKKGYPMIYASIKGNCIELRQERFMLYASENELYPIPITLAVNGKNYTFLLNKEQDRLCLNEEVKRLKINLNRTGFYRVYYENSEYIDFNDLNQYEGWGIINDYFNFYLANKISFKVYQQIIDKFIDRNEPLIVLGISDNLSLLWSINRNKYGDLAKNYHERKLKEYSIYTNEIGKKVYGILAERLARIDEAYSLGLSELFKEYHNIDPNMKDAVTVAFAIAYGHEAYDILLERYRKEKFDEDKLIILKGMLWFRDAGLVSDTLSLALTKEIKRQDVARMIPIVASNPFARRSSWKWLKTNIEFIRSLYKGVGTLGRMLEVSIPLFGLENPDVEKFFSEYNIPEASIGIRSGLELLKVFKRIY